MVPRDASGRPACLATVIRDVSEQRAQQEQLRLSEHRLRQVIEHVADVLFEQDLDGRFTFLNPAWCDATGFTLEESLGRHFVEFVHPDDATGRPATPSRRCSTTARRRRFSRCAI